VGLGFGPVWPTNLGSGQEEYIRVETHFFPHFSFSFSLLSSLSSVLSLLSPPSLTFSDEKDGGRRRRRRGGRPFLDGGAAAANVFFFFFRSSSSTPSPLCFSGLKISKLFIKMPRSKKRKKGNLYFCFFSLCFGSGTVMLELETVVLRFGRVCVLTGLVVFAMDLCLCTKVESDCVWFSRSLWLRVWRRPIWWLFRIGFWFTVMVVWTRRIHDRRVRFGDECGDWNLWKQGFVWCFVVIETVLSLVFCLWNFAGFLLIVAASPSVVLAGCMYREESWPPRVWVLATKGWINK